MLLRSRKYIMSEWTGYIEGAMQLPNIVSSVMEWFQHFCNSNWILVYTSLKMAT
jgi:hypothetical protein